MKIISAKVSNWKSFKYDKNPEPQIFSDFNVFIGPNGGGKTNYVNAIRLLLHGSVDFGSRRNIIQTNHNEFNEKDKPIRIEIAFKKGNSLCKEFKNPNEIIHYNFDPEVNHYKKFFFPKGPEIKLISEYGGHNASGNERYKNSQLVVNNWSVIKDNFLKYFDIKLSNNPPKEKKVFFEDIINETGVSLAEFGSGVVRAFYLITEILILRDQRKIFLFEEPEVHLHPELLKKFIQFIKYVISKYEMQFFITSHSSVLIDETIIDEIDYSIFKINMNNGLSNISKASSKKDKSEIVYNLLGNKASSILLANVIIWVEGPSDRIYLNHWIKSKDASLDEFKHYTIMFYGGGLISHLTYDKEDQKKFIELGSIGNNAAIVIDSDLDSDKEKSEDKYKTKVEIAENFTSNNQFAWITDGREIENYLPEELYKKVFKNCHPNTKPKGYDFSDKYGKRSNHIRKVTFAKKVAQEVAYYDILDLDEKISSLIKWIKSKN